VRRKETDIACHTSIDLLKSSRRSSASAVELALPCLSLPVPSVNISISILLGRKEIDQELDDSVSFSSNWQAFCVSFSSDVSVHQQR
jgi:hypothetical protein